MEQSNTADFQSRLRTGGLRSVSGVMAAFCGLAAVAVFAFALVMFGGVGAAMISAAKTGEAAWRSESITVQARSETSPPCPAPRQTSCPPPSRSTMPARDIGILSAALIVGSLPSLALAYGLIEACRCFAAMAKGRFLARETVSRLTRFAVGGLVFVLLSPHAGAIVSAVSEGTARALDLLTHAPQPTSYSSHVKFTVSGMSEWLNAIYALTLTVVALVMARASSIAEDHAQIV